MLGGGGRRLGASGRGPGGADGRGRTRTGGGGGPPEGDVSGATSLARCRTGGGGGPWRCCSVASRGGTTGVTTNGCAGVVRSAIVGPRGVPDGRGGENEGRGGTYDGRGAVGAAGSASDSGPPGVGLSLSPIVVFSPSAGLPFP